MQHSLADLILSLTPEDGTSINNSAMLTLVREHIPTVTDEVYEEAVSALVDEGTLAQGKGRGGSVYRAENGGAKLDHGSAAILAVRAA